MLPYASSPLQFRFQLISITESSCHQRGAYLAGAETVIRSRCSTYTRNTPIAAARIVGPITKPSNPNTSNPPSTPRNSSSSFKCVRLRSSSGRTMLSATPATPPQITTTASPLPQCPLNPRNSAAGAQISAEPTTGTSEKNAINTAQKSGEEIPPTVNANPPKTPCSTAITSATATLAKIKSRDSRNMSS